MSKVRNAAIIIALCIIAGYMSKKDKGLVMPPVIEQLQDALKSNPAGRPTLKRASRPLNLMPPVDDTLRDALASNPALPPVPQGNTEEDTPPPPRGGGNGGFNPNGGSPFNNPPPPPNELSPSGPPSEQFFTDRQ